MEPNQKRTHSHTCFYIESHGEIGQYGLIANEGADFDPDEITRMLGIEPYKKWRKGDPRRGGTTYGFSAWFAEDSCKERLDIEAQCMETISRLRHKIPEIRAIAASYDVDIGIMITPHIYGEEQPRFHLNRDIIEFCHLAGATVSMDMYIYESDGESN